MSDNTKITSNPVETDLVLVSVQRINSIIQNSTDIAAIIPANMFARLDHNIQLHYSNDTLIVQSGSVQYLCDLKKKTVSIMSIGKAVWRILLPEREADYDEIRQVATKVLSILMTIKNTNATKQVL